mmetsp:Transcript_117137/g.311520  ORF Transcript_117137/g.311520 Transcript_117137/m.311520 type:complete len:287 (-) Transcript_117137:268-1128(-)
MKCLVACVCVEVGSNGLPLLVQSNGPRYVVVLYPVETGRPELACLLDLWPVLHHHRVFAVDGEVHGVGVPHACCEAECGGRAEKNWRRGEGDPVNRGILLLEGCGDLHVLSRPRQQLVKELLAKHVAVFLLPYDQHVSGVLRQAVLDVAVPEEAVLLVDPEVLVATVMDNHPALPLRPVQELGHIVADPSGCLRHAPRLCQDGVADEPPRPVRRTVRVRTSDADIVELCRHLLPEALLHRGRALLVRGHLGGQEQVFGPLGSDEFEPRKEGNGARVPVGHEGVAHV